MTIWTHYGKFTVDNRAFQSDESHDQGEGILMANQTEQQIAWVQDWAAYRDFLISKEPDVRWPKASPQAYYDRGFGKTDVKLSTHVGFSNKMITMHIVFQKAKADARFKQLRRDKERFEARFGEPLEWLAEAASDRHIRITLHSDPADRSKWQMVPLTDRSSSSTVLIDRTAGKQMSDRVGQNEALLARLSIESIRIPARTSFKQVLDFRDAHHGELKQYRTAIRKLAREASGIASVELRLKELKRIVDSELRPADEELRAKLNESRIDFGMSIIRILSAATAGALLSNDIRSGLGVGLVELGFETFTWRRESKKTKTEPFTYLALLKGRFRPE